MSLLIASIIIGLLAFSILLAGLLALIRDPKKAQNRWFFVMALSLAIWMPANFIDSNLTDTSLVKIFLYVDFCAALFFGWSFIGFVDTFSPLIEPAKQRLLRTIGSSLKIVGLLVNAVLTTLILSGLVVDVAMHQGNLQISYESMFFVYIGVILIYLSYSFISLSIRKTHIGREAKAAIDAIYIGFLVAALANLLSNVVFPLIFEERSIIKALNIIGYAGLLVLVVFIYFAITRRRLFDIRSIVARSLAYILLGIALVSVYTALIFGLANRIFSEDSVLASEVLPIVVALFIAATAPFFKRFFDKATNKIFYRDAYDPQAFLDQLNKTLVGNIELGILLRHTSGVIEENLKCNFCFVCVCETPKTPLRVIGADGPKIDTSTMKFIKSELLKFRQKVIVTDDIAHGHQKLKETLVNNQISVIVRLASGYDPRQDATIAYLVLGHKKSGNIYSKQDLRIIRIIADELVIAIQNALRFEEIASFNVTLQKRINQATEKLKATNEKLKEMDETKDEFIGMASHQLRTPLTSAKGYLSMVLDGDAGPLNEQQIKLLNQALHSSQRMVYLIADLLNVSRLKTGKFIIEKKSTNLARLVTGEISQLKGTAQAKNLKLTYHEPDDFPLLMLDETKIRQVIMNFIDNAIYYTPSGGHITVELTQDARYVYFVVRDDGLGVPLDEQQHLFTKFYRASNARQARPDGTGLGLFMAKRVVSAQGGKIIFQSIEGEGSTFGFTFSKKKLKA